MLITIDNHFIYHPHFDHHQSQSSSSITNHHQQSPTTNTTTNNDYKASLAFITAAR
jgi:hypothetical protein